MVPGQVRLSAFISAWNVNLVAWAEFPGVVTSFSLSYIILMAEPYLPPPPAYETSQQEFDRKTSQAIEESLSISTAQPQPFSNEALDDPWDNYDEAAFEAAFEAAVKERESQGGSSGTGPQVSSTLAQSTSKSQHDEKWALPPSLSVQPLRIHKNRTSDVPSTKERPSWFAEAELDKDPAFRRLSGPSATHTEHDRSEPPQHQQPEEDEDRTQAPPPFQSVAPTVDIPPFQEVVMAYHGNGSSPPSPLSYSPEQMLSSHSSHPRSRVLSSPSSSHRPDHRRPSPSHPRQILPPPLPHMQRRTSPRPVTKFSPTLRISQPHMNFDHSVAYSKRDDGAVSPTSEPRAINASAFYK